MNPPKLEIPFDLESLLREMIQSDASDLHITVGEPPRLRIDGELVDSQVDHVLTARDTLQLAYSILTEQQKKAMFPNGPIPSGPKRKTIGGKFKPRGR